MSRYFKDLWDVLVADGIDLDKTEEAILGGPEGDTISLWSAMEARHGVILACIACFVFSILIQFHHCQKQLVGTPMLPMNYIRATICLIVIPIILALLIWRILKMLGHL